MSASLDEILSTRVTTKAISQVAATSNHTLQIFGMQTGGPNVVPVGHRFFGYDIFNHSRAVTQGRAPGAPAGTARPNAVGRVDGTFPRAHEKLPLLAERIHNIRVIGGPANVFDEAGRIYIKKQQEYMGEKIANFRAVLLGGMLRGKLYGHANGDAITYDYTSTASNVTIDYKMPSGNQNQLNMRGTGNIIDIPWNNTTANIPLHLSQINKAFLALCGTRLDVVMCTSTMWQNILNNDYVIAQGGAAATPFITFNRVTGQGPDGTPLNVLSGRLKCNDWVEFIITDEVLDLGSVGSETPTQFIDDTACWFGPKPESKFFEMYEGSEPISEGPSLDPVVKMGTSAWTMPSVDPSGWSLYTLDNAIPVNYIPNASAYGTVVF